MILAGAEKEMKRRRRIKLQRQQSIGRISNSIKATLKKRLDNRVDRKILAARLILKENTQAKNLFGSLSGKQGALATFLKRRPNKTKLVAMNIISEGKEGVCASEKVDLEKKRKAKRKENLDKLLAGRSSAAKLREKKILIDPDALAKSTRKAKLESFLKFRPEKKDNRVKSVMSNKHSRRKSMDQASAILGGFFAKRTGAEKLREKKILKDLSHLRVPHTRLGEQMTPKILSLPITVSSVSCGWAHSMILDTKGNLYAFGMGNDGRLGLGESKDVDTPTQIKALSEVVQAVCGDNHTIALTKNSKVYSWGLGSLGRLGHGDLSSKNVPTQVGNLSGKYVAAGVYHSLVATTNGGVVGFGSNREMQVSGTKAGLICPKPVLVNQIKNAEIVCCSINASGCVTSAGEVYLWGGSRPKLEKKGESKGEGKLRIFKELGEKALKMAFGPTHCLLVTPTKLISWGSNTFGELGRETQSVEEAKKHGPVDGVNGKLAAAITAVACGRNYSAFIGPEGSLITWGRGSKGILGTGNPRNQSTITSINVGEKIKGISCGSTHTLGVTESGKLVAFGNKDHGRLGDKCF